MKRINIYITEETDKNIDNLSELLKVNRSEVMRTALAEFSNKHIDDLNKFMEGLVELETNTSDSIDNASFIRDCSNNPEFFIGNCIKINSIDHGVTPFKLYEYQRHVLFKLNNYNKIIMNTSRQLGISMLMSANILHYVLFNANKTAMIMAPKQTLARIYIDTIRSMIDHLPEFMRDNLVESYNTERIIFTNGSQIIVRGISASATRGMSVNYLFVDQFAYATRANADEFTSAFFPTLIPTKCKLVIASPPNNANHFYKMWTDAISNYNSFHAIKLPWHLIPGRDDNWKDKIISDIGEISFNREFECKFNLSLKGDLYGV